MHNNKIYAMEAVDEDQGDLVREQLLKKYEMQKMQTCMKLNVAWGLFFASTIVSTTLSLGTILGTYTEKKIQIGQTAAKVVSLLPVTAIISCLITFLLVYLNQKYKYQLKNQEKYLEAIQKKNIRVRFVEYIKSIKRPLQYKWEICTENTVYSLFDSKWSFEYNKNQQREPKAGETIMLVEIAGSKYDYVRLETEDK